MNENEEYYTTNNVAGIVKGLSIFLGILGIIGSIVLGSELKQFAVGATCCIVSVVSFLLLYALGELVEIMHDIRTNSEHLRDLLERNK